MSEAAAIVFVVDDDASVCRALERLLRSAGYHVRTFDAAREILEADALGGVACLILDVRMPGQGGLDLHETLAAAGRDPSVVFMTGHGDVAMAAKAMRAGAVAFLPKPFDDVLLLDAVERAVARHREREARRAGTPSAR